MNNLSRKLKLTIGDNEYFIEYPTIGQLMTIESMKHKLTDGQYGDMARSRLSSTNEILDLVDMTSTFTVLIPDLNKSLRVDNIFKISPIEAKEYKSFVEAYAKQFVPWFEDWKEELSKVESVEEDAGDEGQTTESEEEVEENVIE